MIFAVDGFGPAHGWLAFAAVIILVLLAAVPATLQRAADEKKRAGRDH